MTERIRFQKIGRERRRLLKAGKISFLQNVFLEGPDVIDVLKTCNIDGDVVFNNRILKIRTIYFFPLVDERKLDLNNHPTSFSYDYYYKKLSPFIIETTNYTHKLLEEKVECEENQTLFGVDKLYLLESIFRKMKFIYRKALIYLKKSNDQGEFFSDKVFLGKIGSIQFSPITTGSTEIPYKHIFLTFNEYLELKRPSYILVTKESVSYEPVNDEFRKEGLIKIIDGEFRIPSDS